MGEDMLRVNAIAKHITKASVAQRAFSSSAAAKMAVPQVGDSLPKDVLLDENNPKNKVSLSDVFGGKKGVLISIPGAFTPGCTGTHVPSYLKHYDEIKNKGVEGIACVSVNDSFVMDAFGKSLNAEGKIRMLADPRGELAAKWDVVLDAEAALGNKRLQRFSALVDNDKVVAFNLEPPGQMACSLAPKILEQL